MTDKVRIGAVSYLNTRPLVLGMEQGIGAARVELSYDVPAVLADRMVAGDLDIALLPVIELARIEGLELVPGLSISTRGPSRSVLLISRRPVDEVESVALDPESRTSNALIQLLFADVWQRRPAFRQAGVDLDAALAAHDAALRIGDKALFEPVPVGCRVYDLGEVWTAAPTGLPFVYAAWAARPGVVDREIYQVLHDSRRQGAAAIGLIADDYAWNGHHDAELCRRYLEEHIQFRLGSPEIEALKRYLEGAARLGLIERAPEIRMALQRETRCHDSAATLGSLTLRGRRG